MVKKILAVILAAFCSAGLFSCTIVKHSDTKKTSDDAVTFYFESKDFDASAFVEENWQSKVVPEIEQTAQPLEILLDGLRNDYKKTSAEYGVKKEELSPYCFAVKAVAVVKEVNTASAAGKLVLDIPDLSENGFCMVQIGPVIKKSTIRDYLSFIKFGDFENQIEFANISRELNFYIRDNIVSEAADSFKAGDTVSLYGAFTYDETGAVLITPVVLQADGASNDS